MNNIRNMILGICEICDGLIRFCSLGFIHTTFAFSWLIWWEKSIEIPRAVDRIKKDDM